MDPKFLAIGIVLSVGAFFVILDLVFLKPNYANLFVLSGGRFLDRLAWIKRKV